MRKLSKAVLLTAIIASVAGSSYARSVFIHPGAKANAAGGSTPAYAGDVTVIFSNPAALSELAGRNVMLSVFSVDATAKASGTQTADFKTTAMLPFLGGYVKHEDYTFAAGYYASGGGGGKCDNASSGMTIDATEALLLANISASKVISEQVSVGLGIDYITRTNKIESNLTMFNTDSSGSNYQINGGVYYKALENLNTGAVIRSGSNINMSETDEDYKYPMTLGIGAEYGANEKLVLTCGIDSENFSSTTDYKDLLIYHLGARYMCCEKAYLAGGLQTEPALFSKDDIALSPFDSNKYNMTYINLGGGYEFGEWKVNGMYSLGISDKPEQSGTTYEYPVGSFRLDVAYSF